MKVFGTVKTAYFPIRIVTRYAMVSGALYVECLKIHTKFTSRTEQILRYLWEVRSCHRVSNNSFHLPIVSMMMMMRHSPLDGNLNQIFALVGVRDLVREIQS